MRLAERFFGVINALNIAYIMRYGMVQMHVSKKVIACFGVKNEVNNALKIIDCHWFFKLFCLPGTPDTNCLGRDS